MFQEFFSRSALLIWPLVGLLISVAFFVGVLAFVFLGLRDRNRIDELAALPFASEDTATDPAGIEAGRMGRAS